MSTKFVLDAQTLLRIVGPRPGRRKQQAAIMEAVAKWLPVYGPAIGIMMLHRLCDFLSQIGHESAHYAYTREIGGMKRRYAPWFGRGLIQLTWLRNYQAFVRWLWKVIDKIRGKKSPDYSTAQHREKVADDLEIATLTAIFYWQWRKLNKYSDANNYRGQTKAINGGYNGWTDRQRLRGRFGLEMLGYENKRGAYARFQRDHGLRQTDRYDKETERKMWELLKAAPPLMSQPEPSPLEDLPDMITQFLKGGGALASVATALITSIASNFGAGDAAGAVGDLKELDGQSLVSAIAAALTSAGATAQVVMDKGEKVVEEGKAVITELDKVINVDSVRKILSRISQGKGPDTDGDEDTFEDIGMVIMSQGLDSVEDGLTIGLEWGADAYMKGALKRGELKLPKPAE